MEGRGGTHERMVGAVVLKERREDQTISVMAVDWHWQASSSHFIPQCTVLTRNGGTEANEANAPLITRRGARGDLFLLYTVLQDQLQTAYKYLFIALYAMISVPPL